MQKRTGKESDIAEKWKHRRKPKIPYTRDGTKVMQNISEINAIGGGSHV